MDYFPKPTHSLPNIEVPLLDIIPINSRPLSYLHADQTSPSESAQHSKYDRPVRDANLHHSAKTIHTTSWGESYFELAHDPIGVEDKLSCWRQFLVGYNLTKDCYRFEIGQHRLARRAAALLQSWAFFGLLEIVFDRRPLQQEWMHRNEDGIAILRWPRYLMNLLGRARTLSNEASIALQEAESICITVEASKLADQHPVAEVLLSIRLLCQTLRHDQRTSPPYPSKFLLRKMMEQGWCPITASRMMDSPYNGLLLAYYIYTLATVRNQSTYDKPYHGIDLCLTVGHSGCIDSRCKAFDTPSDSVHTSRHVLSRCVCQTVSLDTVAVCNIIEHGDIPLVQLHEHHGTVVATLIKASSGDEYTAISHVWSDGLGNDRTNGLPYCQVEKLYRLLKRVPKPSIQNLDDEGTVEIPGAGTRLVNPNIMEGVGVRTILPGILDLDTGKRQLIHRARRPRGSVLVWMDIFCIPLAIGASSSRANRSKAEAISRMNYVYGRANRTMVLDQELLSLHLHSTSMLEIFARIVVSPWMLRAWTYQEGALADLCHFELADASICPVFLNDSRPDSVALGPGLNNIINGSPGFNAACLRWQDGADALRWVDDSSEHSSNQEAVDPTSDGSSITKSDIGSYANDSYKEPTSSQLELRLRTAFNLLLAHVLGPRDLDLLYGIRDVNSDPPAIDRLETLVNAWNEMCVRSTSMPSELYMIFANMLNLDPTKLPPNEQQTGSTLQSILLNMDLLPVGLLYNTGPRLEPLQYHKNRWMPTSISSLPIKRTRIDSSDNLPTYQSARHQGYLDCMRLHDDGLWTQAETAPGTWLLLLKVETKPACELYLAGQRDSYIKITPQILDGDALEAFDLGPACFMVHKLEPNQVSSGARLYSTSRRNVRLSQRFATAIWGDIQHSCLCHHKPLKRNQVQVHAVYDRPAEFTLVHKDHVPADAIMLDQTQWDFLRYPEIAWRLKIECDSFGVAHRQIPRPTLRNTIASPESRFTCHLIVMLLGLSWLVLVFTLRIIIAAQLGWSGRSTLYKSSLVVFFCFPLTPIPESLFLASQILDNATRPIDVCWVILSVGIQSLAIGLMIAFAYLAFVLPHKVWLRTFSADWPAAKTTWAYYLTFGQRLHASDAAIDDFLAKRKAQLSRWSPALANSWESVMIGYLRFDAWEDHRTQSEDVWDDPDLDE